MRNRLISAAVMGSSAMVLLVGCQDFKDMVGLTPDAPDENTVVRKRPLSMPPDFHLLPPEAHTHNRGDENPTVTAQQALLGENVETVVIPTEASAGDQALLEQAGVSASSQNIREVLAAEHHEQEGPFDKIFHWQRDQRLNKHALKPHEEKAALSQAGVTTTGAPVAASSANVPVNGPAVFIPVEEDEVFTAAEAAGAVE